MRVSVIGGSTITDEQAASARAVGTRLAERGHTIVCGGLGGAMTAVCRGADEAGGHTIGILPGEDHTGANAHVDTPIVTGMGHMRNALVVMNGEAVIGIDGFVGTFTEIGFAGVYDRPIAGIDTHDAPWVTPVESAAAAVEYVESAVEPEPDAD